MKTLKILIVDDNPRFIEALRYMLEENFNDQIEKIDTLLDGSDVLELIKTERFHYDFVFMDISMPGTNGIVVTREATKIYRNLIIIAVSFHSDMDYIVEMIQAGARSYIIKDEISVDSLRKVLALEYTY
jgi:DNA-binding NarL/FixJ family response regulator